MKLKTAVEILETHQKWRLGEIEDMPYEPKVVTQALHILLSESKKILESKIRCVHKYTFLKDIDLYYCPICHDTKPSIE